MSLRAKRLIIVWTVVAILLVLNGLKATSSDTWEDGVKSWTSNLSFYCFNLGHSYRLMAVVDGKLQNIGGERKGILPYFLVMPAIIKYQLIVATLLIGLASFFSVGGKKEK